MSKSITVDFHGLTVEESEEKLDQVINDAFCKKIDEIIIIHGKGKGLLKKAIISKLKSSSLRLNYKEDPNNTGLLKVYLH